MKEIVLTSRGSVWEEGTEGFLGRCGVYGRRDLGRDLRSPPSLTPRLRGCFVFRSVNRLTSGGRGRGREREERKRKRPSSVSFILGLQVGGGFPCGSVTLPSVVPSYSYLPSPLCGWAVVYFFVPIDLRGSRRFPDPWVLGGGFLDKVIRSTCRRRKWRSVVLFRGGSGTIELLRSLRERVLSPPPTLISSVVVGFRLTRGFRVVPKFPSMGLGFWGPF